MRVDQFNKIQALEEKLIDVFTDEADPEHWPGAGKKLVDMTHEERGSTYWSKKNAVATLSLIQRINNLVHTTQVQGAQLRPAAADEDETIDLSAEFARAERDAAKLLDEMQRTGKKAAFDRKTHGTP